MTVRAYGQPLFPFRFFFRPKTESAVQPVVHLATEQEDIPEDEVVEIFHNFSPKQYRAIKQLLVEAKLKSESLVRDESVASDHGRLAFNSGMVAYADYILASFEGLRSSPFPEITR